MFESLSMPATDPILALGSAVRSDRRPLKLDLGIGVYRDENGHTPIMAAVTEAERRLLADRATKTYVGARGDILFVERVAELVLGAPKPAEMAGIQTTGGTGALRILAGLISRARPKATVWLPNPSWANHETIFADAGLSTSSYAYYDPARSQIKIDEMISALTCVPAGDVVLLHGCCHNPCGTDLSADTWSSIAHLMTERGIVPLVDLAYQGFGLGLDEDAAGVRELIAQVPELLLAFSCSKNFGLYSERTGCALVMTENSKTAAKAEEHMALVARPLYSMPPAHGSAIVRTILEDRLLAASWREELEMVRRSIVSKRRELSEALREATGTQDFDYLAHGSGMFSLLRLAREEIIGLREAQGIYAVEDGRINIAGLPSARATDFAVVVAKVLAKRR